MPVARASLCRVAHHRTAIDAKLMEKTGLDEFTLLRIRKAFMKEYEHLSYKNKRLLGEGGTCPRFAFMQNVLEQTLSAEAAEMWLRYLEHSSADLAEMCRGEYPISPYLVRVYSALFGIKVDFLLVGTAPVADRVGANIDPIPLTAG